MKDRKRPNAKPEPVPEMVHSCKQSRFKKKSNNNIPSGQMDYSKGLAFCISKDRPKVYEKQLTDWNYT